MGFDIDNAIDTWIDDATLIRENDLGLVTHAYFDGCKPHTRRAYFIALRRFLAYLDANGIGDPSAVTTTTISRYLEGMTGRRKAKLSPATRAQTLAALRRWFELLAADAKITRNPCMGVRSPIKRAKLGKAKRLSQRQLARLFASMPPITPLNRRDRALVAFLFYTACRIGAALKLTHAGFQPHPKGLRVVLDEKFDTEHTMPVAPELAAYLAPYLADIAPHTDHAFVFRRYDPARRVFTADPLAYEDAYHVIKRRLRAVGIKGKYSAHSFRRTAITMALENGMPIELAQKLANHARVETTLLYDERRQAVSNEDLDYLRPMAKRAA